MNDVIILPDMLLAVEKLYPGIDRKLVEFEVSGDPMSLNSYKINKWDVLDIERPNLEDVFVKAVELIAYERMAMELAENISLLEKTDYIVTKIAEAMIHGDDAEVVRLKNKYDLELKGRIEIRKLVDQLKELMKEF